VTIGFFAGTVTETPPTTGTVLGNVRVEIMDGVNAGKTNLTNPSGQFTIADLTFGTFQARFSKSGYVTRNVSVTLTQSENQNFQLAPTAATITETLTGSVSGGDTPCEGSVFDAPCRRFPFALHHDGVIEGTLTWTNPTNDLDLELWRGDTPIASSTGVQPQEFVSSNGTAGSTYEWRVVYYGGSTIANFTLKVTHPN